MDVYDRRRENLIELLRAISAAELARKSGVSPSYISRCLKTAEENGYKTIGEITARKLEAGAKKPEGWLDGLMTAAPSATAINHGVVGQRHLEGTAPPQINERSAAYRVVSIESAVEGIAQHLLALKSYDKPTVLHLLSILANSPKMHSVVAIGLKDLIPEVRGDPEKQTTPEQKIHRPHAA